MQKGNTSQILTLFKRIIINFGHTRRNHHRNNRGICKRPIIDSGNGIPRRCILRNDQTLTRISTDTQYRAGAIVIHFKRKPRAFGQLDRSLIGILIAFQCIFTQIRLHVKADQLHIVIAAPVRISLRILQQGIKLQRMRSRTQRNAQPEIVRGHIGGGIGIFFCLLQGFCCGLIHAVFKNALGFGAVDLRNIATIHAVRESAICIGQIPTSQEHQLIFSVRGHGKGIFQHVAPKVGIGRIIRIF